MTRVLIYSPYPVVRLGLAAVLGAEPDLRVVGEAGGVAAADVAVFAGRPAVPLPAGVAAVELDPAASPAELVAAVRAAASARTAADLPPGLSEREAEVLRLAAWGYGLKEIAARLKVAAKTVETYKARAAEKLGLRSRVDVVRYALGRGWLAEPYPPGGSGGGGGVGGA